MNKKDFIKFLMVIKNFYHNKGVDCLIVLDDFNIIADKYGKMNDTLIKIFQDIKNLVVKTEATKL